MPSITLVLAGITCLMAMAACVLFVISPERTYDLFKKWNELWGRDFEVLVKSKPRTLFAIRTVGVIGVVTLIVLTAICFVQLTQTR